jgi:ubiquinone/menaquinone biosynthesis C-methylase UbiE
MGHNISSSLRCNFCGKATTETAYECVDQPGLKVLKCDVCNLIQLSDFSHIDDSYYSSSYYPATLALARERERAWNQKRVLILEEHIPGLSNLKVMDLGCGHGGFLEQAQGLFDTLVGFDLCSQHCELLNREGLRCVNNLVDVPPGEIDLIVMFHVLEHVKNPSEFLRDLQRRFYNVDTFVIEVPNTEEALNSLFDCQSYRVNHHSSQHLYYFSYNTLQRVVEDAGLECTLQTGFQRYSLANNFGWLAQGKGGGQFQYDIFNDQDLNNQYEKVLVQNRTADSILFICRPKNINAH